MRVPSQQRHAGRCAAATDNPVRRSSTLLKSPCERKHAVKGPSHQALLPQSISWIGFSSSYSWASASSGGAVSPDVALGGTVTSAPSG